MPRIQNIMRKGKRVAKLMTIALLLSSFVLSAYIPDNHLRQQTRIPTEVRHSGDTTYRSTVWFCYSILPPGSADFYLFDFVKNANQAHLQYDRAVETKLKDRSQKVATIQKPERFLISRYAPRHPEALMIYHFRG